MLEAAFPDPATLTRGDVTLTVLDAGPITRIAPFKGQAETVSAKLGLPFPEPNQSHASDQVRLIWAGRGAALLMGPEPQDLMGLASVVDVSDALMTIRMEGVGTEDVLARLVPLDLRLGAFAVDHAARSLLGHVTVTLVRVSTQALWLVVPRTMFGTVWHELETAMESVANQG